MVTATASCLSPPRMQFGVQGANDQGALVVDITAPSTTDAVSLVVKGKSDSTSTTWYALPVVTDGALLESIRKSFDEARTPNWDGYGGEAVSEATYRQAQRFAEFIPRSFPVPDVGAHPDGHLAFEWYVSSRRLLTVSVDPGGSLHYAALYDESKVYGSEPNADDIPRAILSGLERLYQ